MVTEIKPPKETPEIKLDKVSVFLAGSIEMDKAEDWQKRLTAYLEKNIKFDLLIFNPRRADWDSTWKQTLDDPNFVGQVEWELSNLDKADAILLYFDPTTKAPISLLELGLYAEKKKVLVCCPDGFYRKGNVQITCRKHKVPVYDTFEDFAKAAIDRLTKIRKGKDSITDYLKKPAK